MVIFLKETFEDNSSIKYFVKDIEKDRLQIPFAEAILKVFTLIKGSLKFQVILFQPNVSYMLAADFAFAISAK